MLYGWVAARRERECRAMSKALYRKYRSKSLEEVIGQKHITDILSRALSTNQVSHAYLFTGPRGVGKTSVARILAHAVNKLPYDETATNLDIIEIDAASNNGVEDVRDLREKVQIAPVSAPKKVYIIDEVHMLSKAAFNALLKTLEEPPEHVVFILATTNAENLPATILSRTQRFSFRPISIADAVNHLKFIAKEEKIKITDDALELIALRSDGSFRDSISLLDQMSNLVDSKSKEVITAELIEDTLGLAPSKMIGQIIKSVETHDIEKLVKILNTAADEGINSTTIVTQITNQIRDQIVEKPHLLRLLDGLLDVEKSPQPPLKLLSVLGQAATPKQPTKVMALSARKQNSGSIIADLETKATEDSPAESKLRRTSIPTSDDTTDTPDKLDEDNLSTENTGLDWEKFVKYTQSKYIAVYSVLSKCKYELEDNDLKIYTGNKFYKKKLDDNKYRPLIFECLEKTGACGLNIHTIATAPPPKDSQAAAVVAIMGGGEEVSLESA